MDTNTGQEHRTRQLYKIEKQNKRQETPNKQQEELWNKDVEL